MNIRNTIKRILTENSQKIDSSSLVSGYSKWRQYSAASLFDFLFKKEREKNMIPYSGFANSCATLVSLALLNSGQKVEPGFRITNNETGMKGEPVDTSAMGLRNQLLNLWGKPTFSFKGKIDVDTINKSIGGKTGVFICSPCGLEPCTGHATVWDKEGPLDGTSYHINNPSANIYFWQTSEVSPNKPKVKPADKAKPNLTHNEQWYADISKFLKHKMSGPSIHRGEIEKLIIGKIKTKDDWKLLFKTFGNPEGQDLFQWLKNELTIDYDAIISHIDSIH
jgi:hypothetical protein